MPNYDYANSTGLTALSERTFEKIKSKITTDVVTSEAANPLVIETAAAQKAKSSVITLEPIQDLHGYDHPWPAGGGKNLLKPTQRTTTASGVTYSVDENGKVTLTGTASANNSFTIYTGQSVKEAGTYTCSLNGNTNAKLNGGYNYATLNIGSDLLANTFLIQITSGVTYNESFDVMLEKGSTATPYAPYSNICPISGLDEVKVERTGFNIWDEVIEQGDINTINGNNNNITSKRYWRSKNYIPVSPNVSYFLKIANGFNTSNATILFYFYDYEKKYISYANNAGNTVVTTPNNCRYARFMHYFATQQESMPFGTCINISDPDKNGTYEPYQKFSAEVDLPTTIYGGTLNLETGELVCDRGIVDLGDLTWTYQSNYHTFAADVANIQRVAYSLVANIATSIYKTVSHSVLDASSFGIAKASGANSDGILAKDANYTDATLFKTAVTGQQFAYELATPIVYHLTPAQLDLLKGTNVITVNGKTIQVTYREGSLATLEEVNKVSDALTSEECISEAGNPVTIETDAAQYAKATHLTLAPVQDLHGYDHPWAGGAKKNLLPLVLADIKAANTSGVWSGNAYTIYNVTFTVNVDNAGNVTSITANGTANANVDFKFAPSFTLPVGSYIASNEGSGTSFYGQIENGSTWSSPITTDSPRTIAYNSVGIIYHFYVSNGSNVSNVELHPMIRLSTESDATFEPYSNICPITGVDEVEVRATGKNLLKTQANSKTQSGITWTVNADGTVSITGTATSRTYLYVTSKSEPYYIKPYAESATLTLSAIGLGGGAFVQVARSEDGSTYKSMYGSLRGATPSLTINYNHDDYMGIFIDVPSGSVVNQTIGIQIELGSTPTTYEPYKEVSVTSDLPTTVYSGTLDLETGELVADMGIVDLGTLEWGKTATIAGSYRFYSTDIASAISSISATSETANLVCTNYAACSFNEANANTNGIYEHTNKSIGIYDSSKVSMSQADFKTAMSGCQLCYELATPQTYQLTPQQLALFKGINSISTNAKTVRVTYRNGELATTGDIVASTEVAKQNAIGESASYTDARLATSLAPILGNFATAETSPASASHAVGEYLLYNNRLYKVLAAISAGQQLTIGTNVGQTNVAAELASQASAISALNSNTETKNLGGKSTLSDFNDSLTTLASTMQNYQTLKVRIIAYGNNLQPFLYATYYGTLTRNHAASFFAELSSGLDEVRGEYANGSWNWTKTV